VDQPPSDASTIITQIAQGMGPCGWTGLAVTGHADRSGSDTYNQKLSDRRAANVAAQLASDGVSSSALTVTGKGEKQPAVQTDDGVKEPLNRRVEIMPSPAQ
jgi:outer membrane protein OmpA-like peptidoglycan-associated protein